MVGVAAGGGQGAGGASCWVPAGDGGPSELGTGDGDFIRSAATASAAAAAADAA